MNKLILSAVMGLAVSLSAFTFAATYGGGSGSAADPYRIRTPEHLNTIGANPGDWGKHFKLMADIDMSIYTGTQYKIIGNSSTKFTGTFDGNWHTINNLTYVTAAAASYIGMFGCTSNSTIKNLGLKNVSLESLGNYVGGLVGENAGVITSCYVTGTVSGYSYVGGLAGFNYLAKTIYFCYAAAAVSGTDYVGGLAGWNNGLLTVCYATGAVKGANELSHTGGLAGRNFSGTVTACFWDVQTSGQPSSEGGSGKTTDQMMTLSTFTSAGWDFSDTDGDAADWMMLREGEDYPRLAWQTIYAGDIAGLYGVDMQDLALFVEKWLGVWRLDSDIVDDTIVNMMDLSAISHNWMLTECGDCGGADITGDSSVDIEDITILSDQWLFQENPDCRQADMDDNGLVDWGDFSILAADWMME